MSDPQKNIDETFEKVNETYKAYYEGRCTDEEYRNSIIGFVFPEIGRLLSEGYRERAFIMEHFDGGMCL